jgi:hypothetical protein
MNTNPTPIIDGDIVSLAGRGIKARTIARVLEDSIMFTPVFKTDNIGKGNGRPRVILFEELARNQFSFVIVGRPVGTIKKRSRWKV